MKRIRWGVIGAGGIARRRTIPEGILAAENSELVSVFDVQGCAEIAQQFGAQACSSIEDLLATPIDAVYLATPVYLHPQQVLRCADARKHILCEKPMATEVKLAAEMVRACKQAGVKLGVGLMMRFHPHHQAALKMIRQGDLGTLVFGRAQLSCWYPPIPGVWRQNPLESGGGALMDLGAHAIDLLEQFLGRASRIVCTVGSVVHSYAVEDSALVAMEFASGARGVVDCFFNIPDESSKNRLELYGSAGSLLAEGTLGQSSAGTMTHLPRRQSSYDARQSRMDSDLATSIVVEPLNPYRAEIESFSRTILEDSVPPISGDDGLRNQVLLEACYRSAHESRWVDV